MDILNHNFEAKLPLVLDAINDCDFLTIDAEFSGLHKSSGLYRFNTVQATYTNYASSASSFLLVQIGIATFHWSPTAKRYFAKPFNFYVFPRGSRGRSLNRNFLVQSTAFDFLAGVGFDFNKWVYSGIPYLSFAEEEQFKKESLEKLENKMATIPIDPKDADFVKGFIEKIHEWLLLPGSKEIGGIDIETTNSYRKRLVHQEVRDNYPDLKTIGRQYSVNITKTNAKQREERRMAMQQKFEAEIDIALGFRKVMDAISASKKTIVGHNFFLDLLHLVHQFIAPLPSKVEDFKTVVHELFPRIIDTKHLATACPTLNQLQSTSLENLYFETRLPPFIGPRIETHWDFPKYENSKAHEAAYDAYITGYVFLRLSEYINMTVGHIYHSPDTAQLSFVGDEDSDSEQKASKNKEPVWDSSPNDQQPDIDITNISWDKSFENEYSAGLFWSDDTSTMQTDQIQIEPHGNKEDVSDIGASSVADTSIGNESTRQQQVELTAVPVEHVAVDDALDKAALTFESKQDSKSIQSSDDMQEDKITNCYEEGGLLEQYINKLHIMKSVSDYLSLTSPEVVLNHSTVFRIFSKDSPITLSSVKQVLQQIGEFDLETVDPHCSWVIFRQLAIDQATVPETLKPKLNSINCNIETMYDYLANQGITFQRKDE